MIVQLDTLIDFHNQSTSNYQRELMGVYALALGKSGQYPACEISSVPARQAIFEVTSKREKEMDLLRIELQDAMDPQNRPLSNSRVALSIAMGTPNSCLLLTFNPAISHQPARSSLQNMTHVLCNFDNQL